MPQGAIITDGMFVNLFIIVGITLLQTYLFNVLYFTRCGVRSFPNFSFK